MDRLISRIDERAEGGGHEQPDLRAEACPEHAIEADALVPQGVGPQIEPEAEQHE